MLSLVLLMTGACAIFFLDPCIALAIVVPFTAETSSSGDMSILNDYFSL